MDLGGFTHPTQTCANGMTPLDHAADHSSWSYLALMAFCDLVRITPINLINRLIKTDEKTWPRGKGCIHLLASNADKWNEKVDCMERLLDARAEIDLKTAEPPLATSTTAAIMAASTGFTNMVQLLIARGCDKNAKKFQQDISKSK